MNTIIHAAVRRDIARFVDALDTFPAGSKERAAGLSTAWKNFAKQLRHHHHGEETIFWPALRELGVDESLVSDLGGEHERMSAAITAANTTMRALVADPSAERAATASAACEELQRSIETHFEHEERDLEPVMVKAMDTPELKKAQDAIRRTQTPVEAGIYLAWLQDHADADALAALHREIPPALLFIFSRVLGLSYNRSIAPVWA
jgi:Hemerythrin HHE cation binding domain